ncbi:tRNA synthetases class II family protein, partial [Vibrio parahaemolyticus AQ3810]
RCRRATIEIRLPIGRSKIRYASTRWSCIRSRPSSNAAMWY